MMYKKRSQKDQFKVKPQALTYNYKYIFTGKHYNALAKLCDDMQQIMQAADYLSLLKAVKAMLEADNNRFDPVEFNRKLHELHKKRWSYR